MIDLHDLLTRPEIYKEELKKRYRKESVVQEIVSLYQFWKEKQKVLDTLRSQKNDFNKLVVTLQGEEKIRKIAEMKTVSERVKSLENEVKEVRSKLDNLISKIPSLSWADIPVAKDDSDNPVLQTWGEKPNFSFQPKPYWELEIYKKYVSQESGVKAMGARGYYMRGEMARFQKVLFDFALDEVLKNGFEMFYVPLMLNEKVLIGTGHLPDFDSQMYEVKLDENKSFYLIGSSEPSIMGYFMDEHVGYLDEPVLATCWSSCFRKEAGSYGKDQQGILRVHQFEKVEMIAICQPNQTENLFQKFKLIVEGIYSKLGLHYQAVEVCSGDLPHKHMRQIDYEAYFPSQNKFREVCSNGNASDFQNRGLRVSYTDKNGDKQIPWGLNCTAVTFRTGLAILEQFQQEDGRVKLPEVLQERFGKDKIE